jgi:membrane protein
LALLNTVVSLALFTVLFAAIFKVLPDTDLGWRDVAVGALVTAILFVVGKSLIGWYLGTTAASSAYGAAGALVLVLLWSYYSSQIFLFGAEITRAISGPPFQDGKRRNPGTPSNSPADSGLETASSAVQPAQPDGWRPHRFGRDV